MGGEFALEPARLFVTDTNLERALASIDGLVKQGLADPKRLGVMGLSYGGFLTQWLIGVTDRFRAAASENGVANQASAWANSFSRSVSFMTSSPLLA